jgi:hypothetical protein
MRELGYRFAKQRAMWRMSRLSGAPVVVMTMGKTGSTSVVHALRGVLDRPVFHVHRLTHGSVSAAEGRYRRTEPQTRPHHLWESEFLLGRLPTPDAPWDVVTMTREPLAQAVSAFFQPGGRAIDLRTDSVDVLARTFADQTDYRNPLRWFDREFEPGLDIDVYGYAFDPQRGYGTIETPSTRVLILRTESMAAAPEALAEFFGLLDPVVVPRDNTASNKAYAETYRSFVAEAVIPREILERAYNARYTRHFYSDAEIDAFRRSWEHAAA